MFIVHRCGAIWYNYAIHHPKKVKENMSNKLMFAALAAACEQYTALMTERPYQTLEYYKKLFN